MRWVFGLLLATAPMMAQAEPAPQLARLSWMIGDWRFEDVATPAAGFTYAESGERTCAYALEDRYIRCVSTGRTGRDTRTYVHYWTWNEEQERIELMSLFGNTPSRGLAAGQVSDDGRRIELRTEPYDSDGVQYRSRYVIRFDGAGGYVWESSRTAIDGPEQWTVRFIDTVARDER